MRPDAGIRRGNLALVASNPQSAPAVPTPVEAKQHPPGVWDIPAAPGHRRLVAVGNDGNLLIELNVSERVPDYARLELQVGIERALEKALRAAKV